jgi:long-chain fatty acid transport protein
MHVSKKRLNATAYVTFAVAATIAFSGPATAGGFAIREQSTVFQGTSFAGNAAGGSLSSMFWNPAAAGQFNGINVESGYSLVLPDSELTALPGTTTLALGAQSGDIGDTALVPSSYASYQINKDFVLGLAINAPFGLTTDPSNRIWAGSYDALESKILTYNFNPTLAYRVAPGLIVGAGLQVEYIYAGLRALGPVGPPGATTAVIKGDDVAVGFTAGILYSPAPGTTLGLGYRSKIDHELEGDAHLGNFPAAGNPSVSAGVDTPEIVTLSLRQALAPDWTLLGTVEWTNWSRLQQLEVICDTLGAGPGTLCSGGIGSTLQTLPLGWHDGWFFSTGLEHQYNSNLTLRGGIAYELSPIQDPDERTIRVPDADRFWLSAGASYKWSDTTTLDIAYSHVFVEDSTTDRIGNAGRLVADVDTQVDIISVGIRSKVDWLFSGR